MNNELQNFARNSLKEKLLLLPKSWQAMFKRMYSPNDLEKGLDKVVDQMPESKLDWAMQQVENSLDKQKEKDAAKDGQT